MKQLSLINRRRKGVLAIVASTLALGVASSANAQCNTSLIGRVIPTNGGVSDFFGLSVDIEGDRAVIGAPGAEQFGARAGSAYVFERVGGQWVQQFQLFRDDQANDDEFGISVAMDGNTIVVGAWLDDDYGNDSGSVYVYTTVLGSWFLQAKLLADDGKEGDRFGSSVAIEGDTIVVGAARSNYRGTNSGAAYVYTRSGGVWTQGLKLSPSDAGSGDHFGDEVKIKGNRIAVGATGLFVSNSIGGAVYMYSRSGNGPWIEGASLGAGYAQVGSGFGGSIDLGTSSIVIGSSNSFEHGSSGVGSAYVFTTNDGGDTWALQEKLIADDGLTNDSFGRGVAISSDDQTVIIGADGDDTVIGTNSGSAYVFTRVGGGFIQREKLLPLTGPGLFGASIDLDAGSNLIIGAWGSLGGGYFYNLSCSTCPADINGDGGLNFFDVAGFLNLFNANDPVGDYNSDGILNFFDISAFLADYSAGCP